ncbi:MAG: RIP metalloprotease RseP [Candidatus Puniceispirillales bacterium]
MIETSFFSSLIGFFIVLTPLIFIHELGHYLAAIRSGVKVESFSIGFGPELLGYTDKRNTRWKISLLPLGGYVKMKGELISNEDLKNKDNDSFLQASLINRALIIFSGPLANLLLGLFLITSVFYFNGKYESPPVINTVLSNQPAEVAGLKPGDLIKKINQKVIKNFNDIKIIVEKNPNTSLTFLIERKNVVFTENIIPKDYFNDIYKQNIGRIGVTALPGELQKLYFHEAIFVGLKQYYTMTVGWFYGLKLLITGNVEKKDIAGPIGIAKMSGTVLEEGIIELFIFMAVMSINLGLINLLPIPVLDGGHLCFYIYEAVFRRPLSTLVQNVLLKFGLIFLVSLMILVIAFDLGL